MLTRTVVKARVRVSEGGTGPVRHPGGVVEPSVRERCEGPRRGSLVGAHSGLMVPQVAELRPTVFRETVRVVGRSSEKGLRAQAAVRGRRGRRGTPEAAGDRCDREGRRSVGNQ